MPKYKLDFSLLPEFKHPSFFTILSPSTDKKVSALRLPQTLDRLRGASWFFGQVSAQQKLWQNRAHLRAGLSEFRSVEQALNWDLGSRKVHTPLDSCNPLIHVTVRLRRLAVYAKNIGTYEQNISVNFDFDGGEDCKDIPVIMVENLEDHLLEEMSEYASEDVKRVCKWIDETQLKVGVSTIFQAGVDDYCLELCEKYAHRIKA